MTKVFIERLPAQSGINIYIIKQYQDGKRFYIKFGTPELVEIKEDRRTEPAIELDGFHSIEWLKAFAEALDNVGIETDSDAKIRGTLKATKYHLEDLRQILKLKDKNGKD
ncbi:MAG: hypothetical protein ACW98W_18620 [Candidatus Hodarchaeales archaeon]|jgi:hypothetical protein